MDKNLGGSETPSEFFDLEVGQIVEVENNSTASEQSYMNREHSAANLSTEAEITESRDEDLDETGESSRKKMKIGNGNCSKVGSSNATTGDVFCGVTDEMLKTLKQIIEVNEGKNLDTIGVFNRVGIRSPNSDDVEGLAASAVNSSELKQKQRKDKPENYPSNANPKIKIRKASDINKEVDQFDFAMNAASAFGKKITIKTGCGLEEIDSEQLMIQTEPGLVETEQSTINTEPGLWEMEPEQAVINTEPGSPGTEHVTIKTVPGLIGPERLQIKSEPGLWGMEPGHIVIKTEPDSPETESDLEQMEPGLQTIKTEPDLEDMESGVFPIKTEPGLLKEEYSEEDDDDDDDYIFIQSKAHRFGMRGEEECKIVSCFDESDDDINNGSDANNASGNDANNGSGSDANNGSGSDANNGSSCASSNNSFSFPEAPGCGFLVWDDNDDLVQVDALTYKKIEEGNFDLSKLSEFPTRIPIRPRCQSNNQTGFVKNETKCETVTAPDEPDEAANDKTDDELPDPYEVLLNETIEFILNGAVSLMNEECSEAETESFIRNVILKATNKMEELLEAIEAKKKKDKPADPPRTLHESSEDTEKFLMFSCRTKFLLRKTIEAMVKEVAIAKMKAKAAAAKDATIAAAKPDDTNTSDSPTNPQSTHPNPGNNETSEADLPMLPETDSSSD